MLVEPVEMAAPVELWERGEEEVFVYGYEPDTASRAD